MNIFATYPDPTDSARYLDDQRLVKMISESAQLLSTACHVNGTWKEGMPRPTHPNHPCSVWARRRRANFEWLYEHMLALQAEWLHRYDHDPKRVHAMVERFEHGKGYRLRKKLKSGSTPFANCAASKPLGLDFRHMEDTHLAYRKYLRARWRIQAREWPAKRLAVCSVRFNDKGTS
jgi:hypothetical protein